MNLLLIIPTRERGGAEGYALKIGTAAPQLEVHAAIPYTSGTESLIADLRANGIVCHPFEIPEKHFLAMKEEPLWKNRTFLHDGSVLHGLHALEKGVRRLKEVSQAVLQALRTVLIILRVKPDVVLLDICWATFGLGIILGCGLLKIPTAVVFQLYPFPFVFHPSKAHAYRWARSRNQKWIAVSENNRRLICDSFQARPDEILLIYNGVRANSSASASDPRSDDNCRKDVRHELGLPETARLLLTVARLDRQKGYDHMIPVIPHVVREFEDVWFIWVGEGGQRARLAERLQEFGVSEKVLLLGHRSDVARLMRAADLFLFPSLFEGHPFALLEAMSNYLPIVTSDASGIREIVEDGIHGVIARAGDDCDLLEAIRRALRHPDRMKGMALQARARTEDFTEARMIKETLDVLHGLFAIGKPSGRS